MNGWLVGSLIYWLLYWQNAEYATTFLSAHHTCALRSNGMPYLHYYQWHWMIFRLISAIANFLKFNVSAKRTCNYFSEEQQIIHVGYTVSRIFAFTYHVTDNKFIWQKKSEQPNLQRYFPITLSAEIPLKSLSHEQSTLLMIFIGRKANRRIYEDVYSPTIY